MPRAAVRITSQADADAARHLLARGGAALVDDPALADLLVVDEWTPEGDSAVVAAHARGARVTTLAEGILAMAQGPVVAITGTAGKSSTAHALAHILRAAGRRVRIGTTAPSANAWPDASIAHRPTAPDEVLIAELTSTHLAHMALPHAPDVVVVTIIRPDHHDLHPSIAAYIEAKRSLALAQQPSQAICLPGDDPETIAALGETAAMRWTFATGPGQERGAWIADDTWILRDATGRSAVGPVGPQGPVSLRAIAAAATAALALGIDPDAIAPHLAGIAQPPHRQNRVGRFRDAWIVDDTMAATPMKALAAIEVLAPSQAVVVLGGDPDGHDPDDVDAALTRIAQLGVRAVAFGSQANRIAARLPVLGTAPTVMGALAMAATIAGADGTVLVSPMFPMDPAERDRVAALPEP